MKNWLLTGVFLCLASCSNLTPVSYLKPDIGSVSSSSRLACRYDKSFAGSRAQDKKTGLWYFWRDENRIETRDELSNQGEIWEKDKNGKLSYTRLFFNEGVALDFTTGDLAAVNLKPEWNELNFIINTDDLGRSLKLINQEQIQDILIERYQGRVRGALTEVDWLPGLKLPARIMKRLDQSDFNLVLAECGENNHLELKPSSGASSASKLRHIDFTDLGDLEDDPVVKKLEQLLGEPHH